MLIIEKEIQRTHSLIRCEDCNSPWCIGCFSHCPECPLPLAKQEYSRELKEALR